MKKLITLLAVVGMFSLQGCTGPEGPPGVPGEDGLNGQKGEPGFVSKVFELKNINFSYNATDVYIIYQKLTPNINASDVILIYRMFDIIDSSTPIWQLIPRTIYLKNGRELDYDFDFSKRDFTIYARGNFDLSLTSDYLNDQTFRIVIVPGYKSGSAKLANKSDYSDYNAVIKKYNIDDSNVKVLN